MVIWVASLQIPHVRDHLILTHSLGLQGLQCCTQLSHLAIPQTQLVQSMFCGRKNDFHVHIAGVPTDIGRYQRDRTAGKMAKRGALSAISRGGA